MIAPYLIAGAVALMMRTERKKPDTPYPQQVFEEATRKISTPEFRDRHLASLYLTTPTGGNCSAEYMENRATGERFILTAGHCFSYCKNSTRTDNEVYDLNDSTYVHSQGENIRYQNSKVNRVVIIRDLSKSEKTFPQKIDLAIGYLDKELDIPPSHFANKNDKGEQIKTTMGGFGIPFREDSTNEKLIYDSTGPSRKVLKEHTVALDKSGLYLENQYSGLKSGIPPMPGDSGSALKTEEGEVVGVHIRGEYSENKRRPTEWGKISVMLLPTVASTVLFGNIGLAMGAVFWSLSYKEPDPITSKEIHFGCKWTAHDVRPIANEIEKIVSENACRELKE